MRRTALVFISLLNFIPILAQVDSSSVQSSQIPEIQAHPELNFSGDTLIIGQPSSRDTATDSVLLPTDSLSLPADSTGTKSDTTSTKKGAKKSDIETTINYSAEDSIYYDIASRNVHLYGNTHIDYGKITLEGDYTSMDWSQHTLSSKYTLDSLGSKHGKPVFKEGSDVYETDNILYNFETRRAIIKGVITEQGGAFMHGQDVKKNEKDELFIRGAKYTTCNLSDPHFFIESKKIKAIPGNKIISGPGYLRFRKIITPFWFPFGIFPETSEKASGIVFPSYGQETNRGFYIRNGGYYFGFSDYLDMTLLGSLYSKGSYSLEASSNYKVRYRVSGSADVSYTKNITQGEEYATETSSFWVTWSHTPVQRGNASFSASVSGGSTNYNSQNNVALTDVTRSISSQFTSSMTYTQKFNRLPVNMTTKLSQTQNVQTGIYTFNLPNFTMNVTRFYPFKNLVKNSSSVIGKISVSHSFVAKDVLTNTPLSTDDFDFNVVNEGSANEDTLAFNLDNLSLLYDRAQIGGKHTIPIATSFTMLKYFTVSPSFSYTDYWYTRELHYTYVPEEDGVRIDTLNTFSRAGSWSSGASVSTRLYGMYHIKFIPAIQAIRHVMTPSLSFTYNPDFGDDSHGVYQTIQVDTTGTMERLSKYEGFVYGSPTGSASRTVSFSLTNSLEMKVRSEKDSTGSKKIKLLDNLSMSSGYNFAADSFNLSNITWSARTTLLNSAVSINFGGTLNPYIYTPDGTNSGREVNRYAWNNGQGLGTLQSFNTAVSINLKPKSKGKGGASRSAFADDGAKIDESPYGTEDEKQFVKDNPEKYVDFNMPWSLRVSYNLNRTKTGLADPKISSHGLSLSGSLSLTDNTQVSFSSGYDIKNKAFTTTKISVTRDLHCWTMTFSWVPFGTYQSFNLLLQPKASLLQDLKLQKRRSFTDFFSN